MHFFFLLLSAANISGIFFLADSAVVGHIGRFNPYSLLHVPVYGLLTALLLMAFASRPGTDRAFRYHLAAWTAVAVAAADEYFQSFLPSREPSAGDFFLDILGVVLVLAFARRVPPSSWLRPFQKPRRLGNRVALGMKINVLEGRIK